MVSPETLKLLGALADAAIAQPDASEETPGIRSVWLAPDDGSAISNEPSYIEISGEADRLYRAAVDALVAEPDFQHVARADIDADLMDLCWDLALNPSLYRHSRERKRRVQTFLKTSQKPRGRFEVVCKIENLQLGAGSVEIGDVRFTHVSDELLNLWGLAGEPWERLRADLSDNSVAVVTVDAASASKALERAQETIDRAIDVLRVSLTSFRFRIHDWELLQHRAAAFLVRDLGSTAHEGGWQRGFRPANREISGDLLDHVRNELTELEPILGGKITGKLGDRFNRALQWIGSSATREQYDDKIVDLCTALETLLTTKNDVRKGEAVALRAMLLSMSANDGYYDPGRTLILYEMRSDIVHGSALRISNDHDYVNLRIVTRKVVSDALYLVKSQEITQFSAMVKALESGEHLQSAVKWLQAQTDPVSRNLAKYAEDRLHANQGSL